MAQRCQVLPGGRFGEACKWGAPINKGTGPYWRTPSPFQEPCFPLKEPSEHESKAFSRTTLN
eukprot:1150057-Pelagomonas_calceolata.AAC.2